MNSLGIIDLAVVAIAALFALIAFLNTNEIVARSKRLERKVDIALRRLGALDPPGAADLAPVREALLGGRTVEAIKRYREATGADLKTAKRAVDELRAGTPPQP